ncbi:MAG: HD-GYP domain-containing protein [Solirubrobacteraceae bacterium]
MDDDALAGTRVLVIGGNRDAAESLRAQLTAAGSPSVDLVPALELVAVQAAAARPQVVLSLGDTDPDAVRVRLDPLGLDSGPPVVAVSDLQVDGQPLGPAGVRRLRLVLEHGDMRARLGELEAIVAGQVLAAFRDAETSRVDTLHRLALAAEYRDDNSPEHTQRVGALAARMARQLGQSDRIVALVRQDAPLHDLGKIAIPDSILLKPGRLEPEEFEVVKAHAVLGARVLSDSSSELLGVAEQIARSHHERWDGDGYPDGLAGPDIPLVARLVGVADVFDVLVHERPYKEAWTVEDAAGEMRAGAGTQFDADVVAAFDALGAGSWTAGLQSS